MRNVPPTAAICISMFAHREYLERNGAHKLIQYFIIKSISVRKVWLPAWISGMIQKVLLFVVFKNYWQYCVVFRQVPTRFCPPKCNHFVNSDEPGDMALGDIKVHTPHLRGVDLKKPDSLCYLFSYIT